MAMRITPFDRPSGRSPGRARPRGREHRRAGATRSVAFRARRLRDPAADRRLPPGRLRVRRGRELRGDHRPDPRGRRGHTPPGLRLEPELRDPVRGRARGSEAGEGEAQGVSARKRPWTAPDPAQGADRGRQALEGRPPRARPRAGLERHGRSVPADRALPRLPAEERQAVEGRPGRSVFDLGSNLPQRPDGWTSADAAGLPILPGSSATTRSRPGSSTTRSASPSSGLAARTSHLRPTSRPMSAARRCRRWGCGCASERAAGSVA